MAYIPSEDEILKAVKDSGYLFEQEIATIFENNGFHIRTNSAFQDLDNQVSREMDFIGYKSYNNESQNNLCIHVRVLAECKNNKNPYVFIERKKGKVDSQYIPPNFIFPNSYKENLEGNRYRMLNGFDYLDIRSIYPYTVQLNKAVQFCKIVGNGSSNLQADHKGIYDSLLYPIIKCLEFQKEADRKIAVKHYYIYFPIIVLLSRLYKIHANSPQHELIKTKHVAFTRQINSKKYSDNYLIDFLSKDGIQDFINNNIDNFVSNFIDKISNK
ncbi:hypothetical protein [Galbibacter mesophilus]|uniref:hypothetical protein n=1 Tax=Galbibacter mesophilus TaxID=379069 RepID=UPI00191F2E56|nr:hypothetical protein [Galbibacter mesophilus]MCM5663320.1 hypothetical protein [Galbibacter mesophilus]